MSLPIPEELLQQHIADLGKTGSGKSSVLRVLSENRLKKKKRLCIVDPKGDWWGLKSGADGVSPGYPVIMFGSFKEPRATDVPINERSGKHIAELIATGNRPCVIGLRGWMPSQVRQFWLDFAPTLFNKNDGELYVIIDEVHNLAPKGKILDVESGKCLHWTNRIMSEGRGLGMTFFIASQRPQKVHNDTLDCCETLLAMRCVHPAAREALAEWMKGAGDPVASKQILDTLASLKRGEAWIWSPENEFGPKRVQFPMFETFDSFAPPQVQKAVDQAGWSTVDLEAVKEKLATVIEQAKATDPRELQSRISELQNDLAANDLVITSVAEALGAPDATEDAIRARIREIMVREDGTSEDELKRQVDAALAKRDEQWERIVWDFRSSVDAQLQELVTRLNATATEMTASLSKFDCNIKLPSFMPPGSVSNGGFVTTIPLETAACLPSLPKWVLQDSPVKEPAKREYTRSDMLTNGVRALQSNGSSLPEGEIAVLNAIAQYGTLDKKRLSVLTAYKRSTRDAYLQRLATKGFIETSGTQVSVTKQGIAALGSDFKPIPRGAALHEFWRKRLPEGEAAIFNVLLRTPSARSENGMRKDALDGACGFARSTRDAYLQRMKARGVVEWAGAGNVRLSDALLAA